VILETFKKTPSSNRASPLADFEFSAWGLGVQELFAPEMGETFFTINADKKIVGKRISIRLNLPTAKAGGF
jgi:hypothetical protein